MDTLKLKLSPLKLVLSMLIAAGLVGCVNPAPVLDDNFGNAVNAAKAQQTMNPDAALSAAPPDGIGGQPANAAIDRYHRSFERPPTTPNVFTIGVGSGGAAGSSGSSGSTTR
jgi:hypothetical protein